MPCASKSVVFLHSIDTEMCFHSSRFIFKPSYFRFFTYICLTLALNRFQRSAEIHILVRHFKRNTEILKITVDGLGFST